ncbi:MAG: nitroreductase family protein [Candidatus Omnitrophica bacterium]|nr:nitroreductase family protein [Candidatus Omnitrophota bacterium]
MRLYRLINAVFVTLILLTGLCFAQENVAKSKDALSVIHSRKSVRQYTGVAPSKEQLMTLLKAGMAAPTAMDKRPWAFVVVTDKDMLSKLAEGLPYSKMIVPAGSAIIVCADLTKTVEGEAKEFWIQDCSAASENILLAAEAIGLGAVWTGAYPITKNVEFIQKTLGIPENVIPLNVIAVGNPVGIEKPKEKFDPANIHWEKW